MSVAAIWLSRRVTCGFCALEVPDLSAYLPIAGGDPLSSAVLVLPPGSGCSRSWSISS